MRRFCPECGHRLVRRTRPGGGIPRDICPKCDTEGAGEVCAGP